MIICGQYVHLNSRPSKINHIGMPCRYTELQNADIET